MTADVDRQTDRCVCDAVGKNVRSVGDHDPATICLIDIRCVLSDPKFTTAHNAGTVSRR
jgi:hypothetical protein